MLDAVPKLAALVGKSWMYRNSAPVSSKTVVAIPKLVADGFANDPASAADGPNIQVESVDSEWDINAAATSLGEVNVRRAVCPAVKPNKDNADPLVMEIFDKVSVRPDAR